MRKLKESFEWLNLAAVDKIPKNRLLKVVAKTPSTTLHPEDPNYPVRIFAETQLMRNAASLVGRPVGLDHAKMPIFGAYCIDSEWNEKEKQLEALLLVPPEYVSKVHEGKIDKSSIEYSWRDIKDTKVGKEFVGLNINRIDLLEQLKPGDASATVTLFEAKKQVGVMLTEVTLGEPVARYTNKEDCEAGGGEWDEATKTCKIKPEATTPVEKAEALVTDVKNLTEALQRVTGELTTLKENTQKNIDTAVKEANSELITKIEGVIPKNFILNQSTRSMHRLTEDLKKVLHESRE